MGRLQHLQRLAYGRSAFEELRPEIVPAMSVAVDHDSSTQQYDDKGRPKNPETVHINAQLRHAQNELLCLVGVVDRNDAEAKHTKASIESAFAKKLESEQQLGEDLHTTISVIAELALWWPGALRKRALFGFQGSELRFWHILTGQLSMLRIGPFVSMPSSLLPGAALRCVEALLDATVLSSISDAIALHIRTQHARRDERAVTSTGATYRIDGALKVVQDILLLPLSTYVLASMLGFAPIEISWRKLFSNLLPTYARHVYGSTFASPAGFLASPAVPLILYNYLASVYTCPDSTDDPFGTAVPLRVSHSVITTSLRCMSRTTSAVQSWGLRWLGWQTIKWGFGGEARGAAEHSYQVCHLESSPEGDSLMWHRTTSLALLLQTWLADRLDAYLTTVLLLPLEAVVLHRTASIYFRSGLPLTAAGIAFVARQPGTGLLRSLRSGSTLAGYRSYISAVGLSLAINACAEVAVFGVLWTVIRWQGVKKFGWPTGARSSARDILAGSEP